jgi:uncharacterized protein involved in exopolysaccharide biosynthesis
MINTEPTAATLKDDSGDHTLNALEIMIVLARSKRTIATFTLVVALVAAVISFILPNVYQASTKLLPPQQPQSGAAALLSQLGGLAGAAAGAAGIKNPADLYIGILKSRTISDKIIARFDLKKVYDVDTFEKTRKKLEERTVINAGKDGLITIEVEDEDKKRVAEMANAYVSELMNLTKVIAVTEASQRRVFFERQLAQSKDKLAETEMRFKSAMDKNGVISVDADSRATLETIGRLRAQVSAKEIQLNSMRSLVTVNNPDFSRVQGELASLRQELAKLENGRGTINGEQDMSEGGLQNIKILRDVKYYQMLYELLAKQYEAARLDEAKDSAVIQVLDPAVEPERKIKPKRLILVLVSASTALFVAVLWCLFAESYKRALRSPLQFAKFVELKTLMFGK